MVNSHRLSHRVYPNLSLWQSDDFRGYLNMDGWRMSPSAVGMPSIVLKKKIGYSHATFLEGMQPS